MMYSPAARARLYAGTPSIAAWMRDRKRRNISRQVKAIALKHRRQDYVEELRDLRDDVERLSKR